MNISHPVWVMSWRILLAVVGGYALTYAFSAALARVLPMAATEAVVISALLSFVVYLVFILWAFAEQQVLRVAYSMALIIPLAVIGFWPQLMERLV